MKFLTKYFFLEKLFIEQHYKHITIAKNSFAKELAYATVELHVDSIFYSETDPKHQMHNLSNLDDAIWSGTISQTLIISLTIFGCILSFSLGLLIRYNLFKQKMFFNKINKTNRMIFVVENNANCSRQSVAVQNEK